MRLDKYLNEKYPEQSRTNLQRMIAEGLITVNGEKVKASFQVSDKDKIEVAELKVEPSLIVAENLPIDILYEDSDMIVINKARGMTVHPAESVVSGTLVNALLYHCKDLSGINGVMRPGIVHRLDKDTSGVMVVAKNDKAHNNLSEQIQTKSAQRIYQAIVHGIVKENAGLIEGAIGRSRVDRKKMAIVAEGKSAITEFKVLERFKKYTLVECKLKTGRTHQIRVHMTSIGYPLVGDEKYNNRKNEFAIKGQALHSYTLTLKQPTTGEKMTFIAPIPEDMQEILNELRGEIK